VYVQRTLLLSSGEDTSAILSLLLGSLILLDLLAKSNSECNRHHRRGVREVSWKDGNHAISVTVVRNILEVKTSSAY